MNGRIDVEHLSIELGEGIARFEVLRDLTVSIDTRFVGELEEVRAAFNGTVAKFATIVGQLRQTSGSLKTATGEILSGSNDLAERIAALQEMRRELVRLARVARKATTRQQDGAAVCHLIEGTGLRPP